MLNAVRILGIDPGSRFLGFGIIDQFGNKLKYVHSGCINCVKEDSLEKKLLKINQGLEEIITHFRPSEASIEKIFHSVNAHSSLILGHARGAVLLTLCKQNIKINEFSPNEIKSAVVGIGRASKDQVQSMVQVLLNQRKKMKEDESDALAAAICRANTQKFTSHLPS